MCVFGLWFGVFVCARMHVRVFASFNSLTGHSFWLLIYFALAHLNDKGILNFRSQSDTYARTTHHAVTCATTPSAFDSCGCVFIHLYVCVCVNMRCVCVMPASMCISSAL